MVVVPEYHDYPRTLPLLWSTLPLTESFFVQIDPETLTAWLIQAGVSVTICSCTMEIQQNPLRCLVAWRHADPVSEEPIRGSVGGRNIMIEDNNWMGWLTDTSMVHENILYYVEYYWALSICIPTNILLTLVNYLYICTSTPVYSIPFSVKCWYSTLYSVKRNAQGPALIGMTKTHCEDLSPLAWSSQSAVSAPHLPILHDSTPSRRGVSCLFLQQLCYHVITLLCTL